MIFGMILGYGNYACIKPFGDGCAQCVCDSLFGVEELKLISKSYNVVDAPLVSSLIQAPEHVLCVFWFSTETAAVVVLMLSSLQR